MDLRGYRMTIRVNMHTEYLGVGDYFGTGEPRHYSPRSLEEWVPIAEALAAEHGGMLPCGKWLEKNNYSGIAKSMRKRPELFAHIPQDKPNAHHKTPVQWVMFAEELAAERGGVLPRAGWIHKNHSGLGSAMYKNPELFAHIPQEKPHSPPAQWVPIAEELASGNGGVLPCYSWISKNHPGMRGAMTRHPELFSHIEQERRDTKGRIINI